MAGTVPEAALISMSAVWNLFIGAMVGYFALSIVNSFALGYLQEQQVLLCCCAAVLLRCCAAVLLCCCAAVLLCCCAAVLLCC